MTEIRGKYVYDIQTGKTVGKSTADISQDERQDYRYQYAQSTNTGYYRDHITFSFLNGVEHPEQSGTVEQLSFEQIVSLFIQGNMVVEELRIGLESKGVNDVNITEEDGMTTVTFTYNNKSFTLKCATDAAASQIDTVTSEITETSITSQSTIEESGHFTQYKKPNGYSEPRENGLVPKDYGPDLNEWTAYDYYILLPKINEYFGYNFQNVGELFNGLTDADKKIINQHPEIFHYSYDENGYGQYDMNDLERFWLKDGGYQMNAEEYYSYLVTSFGNNLIDGTGWNPNDTMKCDGQNVEFTDNTVTSIMKYLKDYPNGEREIIKLLGITAEDDEIAIWEKINFFCKSMGSTDGKTISLEKFYLAMGGITYDECADKMAELAIEATAKPAITTGSSGIVLTDDDIEAAKAGLDDSSQQNDVATETKAYLKKLQEQYHSVYEKLSYYLENWYTNDALVGNNGGFRLDWYIYSNNDIGDGFEVNRYLLDVLHFAAGVDTANDSYETQQSKLADFAKRMGATTDYYEIDFAKLMNYLLGDNAEQINYITSFDKIPTEHNFYTVEVSTPEELLFVMKNYRGVNIQLTNDIDLTNYPWETIEEFYGTINGYYELNDGTSRIAQYKIIVGDTPFIQDAIGACITNINICGNSDNFILNNYDSTFNTVIKNDSQIYYIENQVQKNATTNSIPQETYYPPNETNANTDPVYEAKLAEIETFIKDILESIYAEYFAYSDGAYENFIRSPYIQDADNDYYTTYSYEWRDENTKISFTNAMLDAVNKIYEKYSDIITSIGFDGNKIVFSTVYDSDSNGFPSAVQGFILPLNISSSSFEPSVDKIIMLTDPPAIIPNDIPEDLPVDTQGRGVMETLCNGIYVTTDIRGRGVYIWDSKKQKYIKLPEDDYGSKVYRIGRDGDVSGLFEGPTALNSWRDPYLDILIACLIYGYNRTADPTIFEKDGKYYQLTQNKYSWMQNYGVSGFERQLIEIEFI